MRQRLLALALLTTLAAGCGGEPVPPPPSPVATTTAEGPSASTPTPSTPTPSTPTVAPPSPAAAIRLPPDAPTVFTGTVVAGELPVARLVPPGATVGSTWVLQPPDDAIAQVGVVWSRGADPLSSEHGLEIWRPAPPGWRVAFAFTDPAGAGVFGIRAETADLTGDGVPDLLTFEDTGGSGGCGTWSVIASEPAGPTQILRRSTCDTQIQPEGGDLKVRAAVFAPGDSHCCPSAFRTTTLRWNGSAWTVVDRVVTPASG